MSDNDLASVPPQMPPTDRVTPQSPPIDFAATVQTFANRPLSTSEAATPALAPTTSDVTEELRQPLSPVPAASSPIQPPATSTSPQPATDVSLDPRVAALRSMFPDYDELILCVYKWSSFLFPA